MGQARLHRLGELGGARGGPRGLHRQPLAGARHHRDLQDYGGYLLLEGRAAPGHHRQDGGLARHQRRL